MSGKYTRYDNKLCRCNRLVAREDRGNHVQMRSVCTWKICEVCGDAMANVSQHKIKVHRWNVSALRLIPSDNGPSSVPGSAHALLGEHLNAGEQEMEVSSDTEMASDVAFQGAPGVAPDGGR